MGGSAGHAHSGSSPIVTVLQAAAAAECQAAARAGSGKAAKAVTNGVAPPASTAPEAKEPAAPDTPSATFEHHPCRGPPVPPGKATAIASATAAMKPTALPPPPDAAAAEPSDDSAMQLHADTQVREAQQTVLEGRPFEAAQHGAPKPPCQAERWQTLDAIYKSHGGGGGMVIEDRDISAPFAIASEVGVLLPGIGMLQKQ